jgi:hypothetical protein
MVWQALCVAQTVQYFGKEWLKSSLTVFTRGVIITM